MRSLAPDRRRLGAVWRYVRSLPQFEHVNPLGSYWPPSKAQMQRYGVPFTVCLLVPLVVDSARVFLVGQDSDKSEDELLKEKEAKLELARRTEKATKQLYLMLRMAYQSEPPAQVAACTMIVLHGSVPLGTERKEALLSAVDVCELSTS